MKLSKYASLIGVTYKTAHNMYKSNKIPYPCEQLPTGTIVIHVTEAELTGTAVLDDSKVHLYARVSSHDQKDDLVRQLQRMRDFCAINGYIIGSESTEIASGMNQHRKKLSRLLRDPQVKMIVVEHQDRLTRFGFELIQQSLLASGRDIMVINETTEDMDLVQDFIDVVTSMCARIYGKRSANNRIRKMKQVLMEEEQEDDRTDPITDTTIGDEDPHQTN